MSEVAGELPSATKFEEEDDLYGEQIPFASSPRTPPSKRRSVSKLSYDSAKSSTSSRVFSPVNSLDTPATSVSSSSSGKATSTSRIGKRKLCEISVDSDSEESEFPMDEEDEEGEEDDAASFAPAPASENFTTAIPARSLYSARRVRFGRRGPRISQWERTNIALCEHHPELACIWDELETAPLITPVEIPQPKGLSLQLLPFQLEGLDWLIKQEKQVRFSGGILADEMGMGKTIQTIALLLAEPRGKPNLVVAPTVALMQWKSEIETHTKNGLSVCLYYGTSRNISAKQLKEHDVVLTTCMLLYFLSYNRCCIGKCLPQTEYWV
jgi:DNA repair protein RAD16